MSLAIKSATQCQKCAQPILIRRIEEQVYWTCLKCLLWYGCATLGEDDSIADLSEMVPPEPACLLTEYDDNQVACVPLHEPWKPY